MVRSRMCSPHHSPPKHSKYDENTHRNDQLRLVCWQTANGWTDNRVTIYSQACSLFTYVGYRSFSNSHNLATLSSLISIWAFYTLVSDEHISMKSNYGPDRNTNFWATDNLNVFLRAKELNSPWSQIFRILFNKSSITARTD